MGSLKSLQNRLDQHQTILLFQAAFALLKGSLKRLRYGNGKEWVWRRYAMFCFPLREGLRQPENG